ncbi:MAG: NUDIX domain-containing protein [Dermatophilaceae bacterium]
MRDRGPTGGAPEPPRLVVVGVDGSGAEVVRFLLGHGDDPVALLASHGWEVRKARDVASGSSGSHVLTMTFGVSPHVGGPLEPGEPLRRDKDLPLALGETPEPYQRVAAYAVATSSRGVLMTQFSQRTNAQGQWGLPGGGIEVDEPPEQAVVREVWEESGQVIEVSGIAVVSTTRWIGRAPSGRLEDFHAVRLVYRASCHAPTDPVVHDVGGTTESARWVPPADLGRLDVASSWRSLMSGVVMAPDEADGPQHHEHQSDGDDPARPKT